MLIANTNRQISQHQHWILQLCIWRMCTDVSMAYSQKVSSSCRPQSRLRLVSAILHRLRGLPSPMWHCEMWVNLAQHHSHKHSLLNERSVVAAGGSFTVQIVAASFNNLTRHKENEILIYIGLFSGGITLWIELNWNERVTRILGGIRIMYVERCAGVAHSLIASLYFSLIAMTKHF